MGLNAVKDIYSPLAKKEMTQDVVSIPAGGDTISCGDPEITPDKSGKAADSWPAKNSWEDTAPVILLSGCLKANTDLGCHVYLGGKDPDLPFPHGLRREALGNDRWKASEDAVVLISARYRIRDDHKCDAQVMSQEYSKRLDEYRIGIY